MNILNQRLTHYQYRRKIEHQKVGQHDNSQQQQQERTEQTICTMLVNIKTHLIKAKQLTQLLITPDEQEDEEMLNKRIVEIKERQSQMKFTQLSNRNLSQQMARIFVFKLIKELQQWKLYLSFAGEVIASIEQVFQNQKSEDKFNIVFIYYLALNRITVKTNQKVSEWLLKNIKTPQTQIQQNKIFPKSHPVQRFRMMQNERQKLIKQKELMIQTMNGTVCKLYWGLQIEYIHPIKEYLCELKEEENIKIITKQQIKRNKRVRKDVVAFGIKHEHYIMKKTRKIFRSKSGNDGPGGVKKQPQIVIKKERQVVSNHTSLTKYPRIGSKAKQDKGRPSSKQNQRIPVNNHLQPLRQKNTSLVKSKKKLKLRL